MYLQRRLRMMVLGLTALALLLTRAEEVRAGFVIGLPADSDNGNEYPFGANYGSGGTGEYQQVYAASAFPGGPITITGLQFFNTQYNFNATSLPSATVTISLSTTSANWNTLSSTYGNNIGGNNTAVFSGNLSRPWAFGDTLSITLTTPFTYNPAPGSNLLMDVEVSGASNPGGSVFFDANGINGGGTGTNTIMGRVFTNIGSPNLPTGNVNPGYGLVTGFETSATPTPEPATLTLLASAFAAGGFCVYRRRRATTAS